MGYYTYFNLDISYAPPLTDVLSVVPDSVKQEVCDAIKELTEYIYFDTDGQPGDSYKWYEWESDMIQISEKFPWLLLTLWGDGEESDDKWVAYFVNGKVQHAQASINYPEFDETALRPLQTT